MPCIGFQNLLFSQNTRCRVAYIESIPYTFEYVCAYLCIWLYEHWEEFESINTFKCLYWLPSWSGKESGEKREEGTQKRKENKFFNVLDLKNHVLCEPTLVEIIYNVYMFVYICVCYTQRDIWKDSYEN